MEEPAAEGTTSPSSMEIVEVDFNQLLASPETKVSDLLVHSEFMSNFEYQSPELFAYFQKPQVAALLPYITEFPADPSDTQRCHRFPFLACEVLCARSVCETILEDEELFQQLLAPLQRDRVDLLLIGYIMKVITTLAASEKTDKLLELMLGEKRCVDVLFKHAYSLSVTDTIVNLLGTKTSFIPEKISVLLRIISLLQIADAPACQYNAFRALLEVINQSEVYRSIQDVAQALLGESALQQLSAALESQEERPCRFACQTIKTLLGTQAFRIALGSPDGRGILDFALAKIVVIVERQMQLGIGKARPAELNSQLTSLLGAICKVDIPHVRDVILSTSALRTATTLFLEQEMNSFLACEYFKLIGGICGQTSLREFLVKDVGIQDIIIRHFASPTFSYNSKTLPRRPLLGFLTKISNLLISTCSMEGAELVTSGEWDTYVTTTLRENNKNEQPFSQLGRRSSSLSQDLNEDVMLQNAPPMPAEQKPEDVRVSEESTTPVIRQRALNVKSKLMGMDDEVSAPKPAAPTPNMNPVYPYLLSSEPDAPPS